MQRIAFLKWMRSWTKKYGHRWRSMRRNGPDQVQSVRCTQCDVRVQDNGRVVTAARGFGNGERCRGGGLREWIETSLPVCRSMEKIVYDVMLE